MNNNSSKQVLLSVIGVAILVVAVVGVSFAFFSYTTTGVTPNTVQTGTIVFTASTNSMTLTNVFPTAAADEDNVATVSIYGSTTYDSGIDFVVRAVGLTNAGSANDIHPTITVKTEAVDGVTYTDTYDATTDGVLVNNDILVAGTIAGNATVGTAETPTKILTVSAFYDRTKYHITDNEYDELEAAGILPSYVTEDTALIDTAVWNAMIGADAANPTPAYSFSIQINATQNGAGRLGE